MAWKVHFKLYSDGHQPITFPVRWHITTALLNTNACCSQALFFLNIMLCWWIAIFICNHVSFVNAGKSPFFPGLEEQAALLEDPSSHLVDGQVLPQPAPPLSSPSRSSPHSQGSETGERYSRKVFVGGLPPDIDEGMLVEEAVYGHFLYLIAVHEKMWNSPYCCHISLLHILRAFVLYCCM